MSDSNTEDEEQYQLNGSIQAGYCFEDLYTEEERNFQDPKGRTLIPEEKLEEIITLIHASSHRSVDETLKQLEVLGLCYDIKHHQKIVSIIRNCNSCKYGKLKGTLVKDSPIKVGDHPFHIISMDAFQVQIGKKNFLYLGIVDHFSKFFQAYLLKNRESETIVNCLWQWISSFGYPFHILSDNAREFTSEIFQEFLRISGILHLKRGVARSKSNGIIERKIRDFKSILRVKLQDQSSEENYTRLVSEALIVINITRGNQKFSPVEKLFICKWNFRGIQGKALVEKPERDLIDHMVWIKGKDNDLSKPLYQERGKIIRQFGNKQFEILLEDGKKTTLHINDLLL